jgi:hypothetical protein
VTADQNLVSDSPNLGENSPNLGEPYREYNQPINQPNINQPSKPEGAQAQAAPSPRAVVLVGRQTPLARRREPDFCYEQYADRYLDSYGLPYRRRDADFVQLASLRHRLGEKLVDELWLQALENYFATPQGSHTLADVCCRF